MISFTDFSLSEFTIKKAFRDFYGWNVGDPQYVTLRSPEQKTRM